ncbi:hypothetical protein FLX07_17875 [Microbispora bryophytorum]|nr:hypothetical protein FLX07_17875 [Microbispora bryophytorum]
MHATAAAETVEVSARAHAASATGVVRIVVASGGVVTVEVVAAAVGIVTAGIVVTVRGVAAAGIVITAGGDAATGIVATVRVVVTAGSVAAAGIVATVGGVAGIVFWGAEGVGGVVEGVAEDVRDDLLIRHPLEGAVQAPEEEVHPDVIDRTAVTGPLARPSQLIDSVAPGRRPIQGQVQPGHRRGAVLVASPHHPAAAYRLGVPALRPGGIDRQRQALDSLDQLPHRPGRRLGHQLFTHQGGLLVGQPNGPADERHRPGFVQGPGQHRLPQDRQPAVDIPGQLEGRVGAAA